MFSILLLKVQYFIIYFEFMNNCEWKHNIIIQETEQNKFQEVHRITLFECKTILRQTKVCRKISSRYNNT